MIDQIGLGILVSESGEDDPNDAISADNFSDYSLAKLNKDISSDVSLLKEQMKIHEILHLKPKIQQHLSSSNHNEY